MQVCYLEFYITCFQIEETTQLDMKQDSLLSIFLLNVLFDKQSETLQVVMVQ